MADKMMRTAGRGHDGNAKPLRIDQDGDLNVSDIDVKTELELIKQENAEIKQLNQQILERLDGTLNTQVTGSNVKKLVRMELVTALALTDTYYGFSIPSEISKYANSVALEVYSTLNQDVKIRFSSQARITHYDVLHDAAGNILSYTMPASQPFRPRYIDGTALSVLSNPITNTGGEIRFSMTADVAPTSGFITVIAYIKIN